MINSPVNTSPDFNGILDARIQYNRLLRKFNRTKNKLGVAEKLNEHYNAVLRISPFILDRHEKYEEKQRERVRVQGLEDRVKEQEAFIGLLQKQINKE